jgi:hypothetical protein
LRLGEPPALVNSSHYLLLLLSSTLFGWLILRRPCLRPQSNQNHLYQNYYTLVRKYVKHTCQILWKRPDRKFSLFWRQNKIKNISNFRIITLTNGRSLK